ncbi:MAG: hypothetical protein M0002_00710 [Rhodospirillales bacterium]|nr:hypothetical protein [Rhodospirillales bacterium]
MIGRVALIASVSLAVLFAAGAVALAAGEKLVTQSKGPYGAYVSADNGRAVYMFTADHNGMSACHGACTQVWPPVMTKGAPIAGPGVDSAELGTIGRKGGTQITYAGKPLYYFVGDKGPGTTAGEGLAHFGGKWYLVTPTGNEIEKTAAAKSTGSW